MTYNITYNAQFGSQEIYFDGKPSDAVRSALKELKFRWHSVKRCWYGYAAEETIAKAITGTTTDEEPASVVGDGYMGGGSIYGSKSHRRLYGADLSAAIRADLKAAGIKGVTVKVKSYAGGQNITATVSVDPGGYQDRQSYIDGFQIQPGMYWLYAPEIGSVHIDKYYRIDDAAEREQIRVAVASYQYDQGTTIRHSIRHDVSYLTAETRAKLEQIETIIAAYRYDNSNSMVDYFDTNFYYDIRLKPVAA